MAKSISCLRDIPVVDLHIFARGCLNGDTRNYSPPQNDHPQIPTVVPL
jgi:hypothetical protein